MLEFSFKNTRHLRWGLAAASVIGLSIWPIVTPQAQRGGSETPVSVTGVTTHTKGQDAVVTVSGDGALSRAQTWQDDEGFHVVVYKGQGAMRNLPRGVKARRVGDSLELIVPVKPGGSVYVEPRFNQLDLVVGGGLQAGASESARQAAHASPAQASEVEQGGRTASRGRQASEQSSTEASARESEADARARSKHKLSSANSGAIAQAAHNEPPASAPAHVPQAAQNHAPPQVAQNILPSSYQDNAAAAQSQPPAAQPATQPAQAQPVENSTGTIMPGSTFSVLGVGLLVGMTAVLFIYRRRRNVDDGWEEVTDEETSTAMTKLAPQSLSQTEAKAQSSNTQGHSATHLELHPQGDRRKGDNRRRHLGRRADDKQQGATASAAPQQNGTKSERKADAFHLSPPAVIFGAFRIDQEVEKLLQGQPHSIEVLASRAPDDRRAVETSLLKALQSSALGEAEKRRARAALEEYGFVARESATLLAAHESYERTSAARVLGQIGSPASLPFLLEALHDHEHVVCTEAVASLGTLGLPSAIGALLDLARRHPELPAPLLSRALSACSLDCVDVQMDETEGRLLGDGLFTGDIDGLEPVAEIEQLPEWLDDPMLADALERLSSTDVEARTAAAQQLAQFQVQRAVEALAFVADTDPNPTVRATAVTSLGIIGHESVFAAILIAMADEAREVRAAAARALSRLSFDRADAYVRVIESYDAELKNRIAQASVKAGLATKALDRLASEDRRQAYEAFSLLSLVIKGGATELILQVVEQPGELGVRLAAARLLALQGGADAIKRLRRVALGDGAPEKLRNAILEAIYRDDHAAVE
ncbi:MAG: hypothetical protein DMF64_04310 [Acidobacteria bacterium]|nr:MAG: hypothetical protein DMF64_04310 [Acidobacteriota bacterium]